MANPNIVNVTSIFGKSQGQDVTTTNSALLTNSSGSGVIIKVNMLSISNVDGANPADISVEVFKNQSTSIYLARTVNVPENATLMLITKESSIYLEENDSIRVLGSANGDLQAFVSYEEIS